jgi:hypothetical protein
MRRKRDRSESHGILYDGADPASLLSCGVDLPQNVTEMLLRGNRIPAIDRRHTQNSVLLVQFEIYFGSDPMTGVCGYADYLY